MDGVTSESGAWPWPDTLDAVIAAPGSHRVLFENERIRVLEVRIGTGQREPTHTHRWPSVMLVDRPARIRYYAVNKPDAWLPIGSCRLHLFPVNALKPRRYPPIAPNHVRVGWCLWT
jgi:hypothetical protein